MSTERNHTLSSWDERRVAEIQALAVEGAAAAPLLVELLAEPSWVVRRAVTAALVQVGTPAIPLLCDVLATKRSNEAVIAATVETLVASRGEVEGALLALGDRTDVPAVLCDVAQILGRRRCKAAFERLVAWTTHPDDNVAVAAIESLGRLGGPEVATPLIAALQSGSFFRVFPAIAVLGQTGDARAVGPLSELLGTPHYRMEAVAALGRTGQLAAVAPLARLLATDGVGMVRRLAVALLDLHTRHTERFGDDGAVAAEVRVAAEAARVDVAALAHAASAGDSTERLAVSCVLAWLGNASGIASLVAMLEADPATAQASFLALGRLQGADAQLRAALASGSSSRRSVLLPLLARRRSAVAEIAECLSDADPAVRAQAADALGRLGDVRVVPRLFENLGDADARVDQAVVGAIQSLGCDETRRRALAAVGSTDPRVRRSALRIVSYFGYPEGLDLLLAAALDEDERIRDAATAGLALSDDPRAVEALLAGAERADPASRAAAMRALGGTHDLPAVVRALSRGLEDPDVWVRYYACQALGRLHVTGASDAIARLLTDDGGQVRVSAIDALARLGGDRALALLAAAAKSTDDDVRRAAVLGLGALRRPHALPVLVEALASPDAATRLVAVSAIAESHTAEATLALIRARADQDVRVREAAFSLLTHRHGSQVTSWLVEQLAIESERPAALHALAISADRRVEDILVALEGADSERARLLVQALLCYGLPAGKAAAELALQLNNVHARRAAAEGLVGTLNGRATLASIEQAAAGDLDPEVRRICARAG